ncbi:MAG: aldo/keto reductase [Spirochaetales bacterium]|jgi:myo-inositol catabolism protein IolS|nr:aldo/keto reductase [Spirochaetales bacterium]
MLYREFGKTGWKVSAIGQGCWNIGNQWGEMSDAQAERILRAAYDNGINLFDTAESYGSPNGTSELRLGSFIKRIDREKIYVVSKIGNWGKRTGQGVPKTTADMIRACGHACCGRMRTDYVDVMLCHEGDIEDPSIYIEGFKELRDEGFVHEYGISTNSVAVLTRFNDISGGECAVVELDYSLLNKEPENDILPYCIDNSIAVLVRGPLAMGLLSGRYDENTVFEDQVRSKWNRGGAARDVFEEKLSKLSTVQSKTSDDLVTTGLRYVISHAAAPVAIPGATRPEQAISNAAAGAEVLDAEALQNLR